MYFSIKLFLNMNAKALLIFCLLTSILFSGCKTNNPEFQKEAAQSIFIHDAMKQLTDIIVHDIFSPPVAARIYSYPSIAAYEALLHDHPKYNSFAGQLNGLNNIPQPEQDVEYCYPLASVYAFTKTGKTLIFSEDKMEEFENKIFQKFKDLNMPQAVYDRSIAYGQEISDHILAWADKDKYKETRTYPKYTITEDPSKWKPTPPDYMDGIEPHWKEIRPYVLKSASQFNPGPPAPYDMKNKNSKFYKDLMEVYEVVKNKTEEEVEIASFWDCNPYVSHHSGHVMFATKKITPGGHWVGITAIAAKQANADMMETIEAYAMVSLGLMDAFISCWDEKYRSGLIRPETVINTFIDEDWLPVLQTPPFPEHTSGHSVVSGCSSTILTKLFGDNFAYKDDVEVEYGLPERKFASFKEAAAEAAISRLYGGIHYRPAIDMGLDQGNNIGEFILKKVKTRG